MRSFKALLPIPVALNLRNSLFWLLTRASVMLATDRLPQQ